SRDSFRKYVSECDSHLAVSTSILRQPLLFYNNKKSRFSTFWLARHSQRHIFAAIAGRSNC
ncbi:MAG: hypothetical protein ABJA32_07890, partial [Ginsengibacter sp.]